MASLRTAEKPTSSSTSSLFLSPRAIPSPASVFYSLLLPLSTCPSLPLFSSFLSFPPCYSPLIRFLFLLPFLFLHSFLCTLLVVSLSFHSPPIFYPSAFVLPSIPCSSSFPTFLLFLVLFVPFFLSISSLFPFSLTYSTIYITLPYPTPSSALHHLPLSPPSFSSSFLSPAFIFPSSFPFSHPLYLLSSPSLPLPPHSIFIPSFLLPSPLSFCFTLSISLPRYPSLPPLPSTS